MIKYILDTNFFNAKLFRYIFFIFVTSVITFFVVFNKNAHGVKIVAIVNESVITDVDVENFANSLCKIEKKLKCGSAETTQVAMYYLIEAKLKLEHFRQTGIDFNAMADGFKKHKADIIKSANMKDQQNSEQFNDYLLSEYIWNIAISSQIKPNSIKTADIENFAKSKKIEINKENFNNIKQQLLQQKYVETANRTLEEIKKIYLVDVKV